jgi:putative ABC transport system ATP-binding protein
VIEDGEWLAVQGRTGHGKPTLLNLFGGLDRPAQGTVELDGTGLGAVPETQLTQLRAEKIGFIFQTFNLIPTLSAAETVEAALIPLGVSGAARRAKIGAALESVSLADRAAHLPTELSGGQQQRVAIARALVKEPKVLLADEPTGNFDQDTRDDIITLLEQLWRERGLTLGPDHPRHFPRPPCTACRRHVQWPPHHSAGHRLRRLAGHARLRRQVRRWASGSATIWVTAASPALPAPWAPPSPTAPSSTRPPPGIPPSCSAPKPPACSAPPAWPARTAIGLAQVLVAHRAQGAPPCTGGCRCIRGSTDVWRTGLGCRDGRCNRWFSTDGHGRAALVACSGLTCAAESSAHPVCPPGPLALPVRIASTTSAWT